MATSERSKRRRIASTVRSHLAEIRNQFSSISQLNSQIIFSHTSDSDLPISHSYSSLTSNADVEQLQDTLELNLTCDSKVTSEHSHTISLRDKIAKWSVKNNITHVALKELIPLINDISSSEMLPLDPRTVLSTPRKITKSRIGTGYYTHIGLKSQVSEKISKGVGRKVLLPNLPWLSNIENLITISIGIDGLPLSRSSNSQFWPILGCVDQSIDNSVFIIGLYFGETKPDPLSQYLSKFVEEMTDLESYSLTVSDIIYNVRLRCIIADAPARSFLKGCTSFNAYNGCERCHDKGRWFCNVVKGKKCGGRVIHVNLNSQLRQDSESIIVGPHFIKQSPLNDLKIGLVTQFPLDYMQLLFAWVKGKIPHRISHGQVNELSSKFVQLGQYIPSEFARRPRSFKDLDHFKATEYRQILLYTGPLIFKNVLPDVKYKHFLHLSVGIFILLSSKKSSKAWISYSRYLLQNFIRRTIDLYSKDFLVYNFHSLSHLADDAEHFGSLDEISAFKYENYMRVIKKMLRGNNNHLEQASNRLAELQALNPGEKFARVKTGSISSSLGIISSDSGDNCFLQNNGDVVMIESVNVLKSVNVRKFLCKTCVPDYPCSSDSLCVFNVRNLSDSVKTLSLEFLFKKCVLLPNRDGYLCIPMIHSINE